MGPTTVYAFMQAMGLTNDHLEGCHARAAADAGAGGFTAAFVGAGQGRRGTPVPARSSASIAGVGISCAISTWMRGPRPTT